MQRHNILLIIDQQKSKSVPLGPKDYCLITICKTTKLCLNQTSEIVAHSSFKASHKMTSACKTFIHESDLNALFRNVGCSFHSFALLEHHILFICVILIHRLGSC